MNSLITVKFSSNKRAKYILPTFNNSFVILFTESVDNKSTDMIVHVDSQGQILKEVPITLS